MKYRILLVATISLGFFFTQTNAQAVQEESGISVLRSAYTNFHQMNHVVKGYQILLLSTDNRRKMELEMERFQLLYPQYNVDFEHRSPYYMLRAGAFRSKNELQYILIDIKKEFPSAIAAPADIDEMILLE